MLINYLHLCMMYQDMLLLLNYFKTIMDNLKNNIYEKFLQKNWYSRNLVLGKIIFCTSIYGEF